MGKQFYLNLSLLVLCAVLLQAMAVISDGNIEESSNFLVREKRVIDKTRKRDRPVPRYVASHMVNIQVYGVSKCGGSILNPQVIITTAKCLIQAHPEHYSVLSGSLMRNSGFRHNITKKILHPHFYTLDHANDLGMIKISPPIHDVPGIPLYDGLEPENTYALFTGWGCTGYTRSNVPIYPEELRTTRLPLIGLVECILAYHETVPIIDKHICTLDTTARRGACTGDEGGPLIYNNSLLGIYSYRLGHFDGKNPDVFVNVNLYLHQNWAQQTMQDLLA